MVANCTFHVTKFISVFPIRFLYDHMRKKTNGVITKFSIILFQEDDGVYNFLTWIMKSIYWCYARQEPYHPAIKWPPGSVRYGARGHCKGGMALGKSCSSGTLSLAPSYVVIMVTRSSPQLNKRSWIIYFFLINREYVAVDVATHSCLSIIQWFPTFLHRRPINLGRTIMRRTCHSKIKIMNYESM